MPNRLPRPLTSCLGGNMRERPCGTRLCSVALKKWTGSHIDAYCERAGGVPWEDFELTGLRRIEASIFFIFGCVQNINQTNPSCHPWWETKYDSRVVRSIAQCFLHVFHQDCLNNYGTAAALQNIHIWHCHVKLWWRWGLWHVREEPRRLLCGLMKTSLHLCLGRLKVIYLFTRLVSWKVKLWTVFFSQMSDLEARWMDNAQ